MQQENQSTLYSILYVNNIKSWLGCMTFSLVLFSVKFLISMSTNVNQISQNHYFTLCSYIITIYMYCSYSSIIPAILLNYFTPSQPPKTYKMPSLFATCIIVQCTQQAKKLQMLGCYQGIVL